MNKTDNKELKILTSQNVSFVLGFLWANYAHITQTVMCLPQGNKGNRNNLETSHVTYDDELVALILSYI